jgi:hypothetical protein
MMCIGLLSFVAYFFRHCEPPGPAAGRPDDRLREAIQTFFVGLDCFVAPLLAMTAKLAMTAI